MLRAMPYGNTMKPQAANGYVSDTPETWTCLSLNFCMTYMQTTKYAQVVNK